jgi:transposase InsO family protein
MAWARTNGWVWVFACVDHDPAEIWTHVAKVGDRFAALQPVSDGVIDRWGRLDADVARGLSLRHDWGPQHRSGHFLGLIGWLGIADDAALLGEPETNGCAKPRLGFSDRYNTSLLIGRLGHQTPKEAYQTAQASAAHDQLSVAC